MTHVATVLAGADTNPSVLTQTEGAGDRGEYAVETLFSALSSRRLKRGAFTSIADLQAAINRYITEHNDDPKPFIWTKPADTIFASIDRSPAPFV